MSTYTALWRIGRHGVVIFAAVWLLIFSACGGGGGGGGGASEVQYTGATTMATLAEGNVTEFAVGSFMGGPSGQRVSPAAASGSSTTAAGPLVTDAALAFNQMQTMFANIQSHVEATPNVSVVYNDETVEYGNCGGSLKITISINSDNGAFSGTMTYSGFCNDGVTESGVVSFSGAMNLYTGDFDPITMSFGLYTASTLDWSISMSGSATGVMTYDYESYTMNYRVRDNGTGKVYKVENYSVAMYWYFDHVQLSIDGRYYHPDYGFVEASTALVFNVYAGASGPASGELGVAGSDLTRARLVALTEATFEIDADCDSDGTFEWSSGPLDWSAGAGYP